MDYDRLNHGDDLSPTQQDISFAPISQCAAALPLLVSQAVCELAGSGFQDRRMTIEQLRTMHQARPFKAFRVHLADGRSLDVKHPESLAHTTSGRTVMIAKGESFEVIDLLLVTSLEPINGRARRRRS